MRKSGSIPETNEVVRRMFIGTADQNYATARWALMNELDVDFLWLGLHALEKYFKAILLLNGNSAKDYSHNIESLYREVLQLDPALSFGTLVKPAPVIPEIWRDETLEAFIKRMNEQGNPNNRYMSYGYSTTTGDLFKLDQLVWSVRRHCRPFHLTLRHGKKSEDINWVKQLKKQPGYWHLNRDNLIERAESGSTSTGLRHAFFNLNFAFSPEYEHIEISPRFSAHNPPLAEWFRRLQDSRATPETRQIANDVLHWVLDNISLSKRDRTEIKDALTTTVMTRPTDMP